MRSILGLDTASPRGSVALLVDGTVRGSAELAPGGHSDRLAAACGALVADAGLSWGDLSGIGVSRGPGSFTGLRIGLAWAKGVAFASGLPLLLVSAHEAAARAAREREAGRARITVTPGERQEIQVMLWAEPAEEETGGARPRSLAGPTSVSESDAAERIRALAGGRPYVALPANEAIASLLEEEEIDCRPPAALAVAVAEIARALLLAGEIADLAAAAPEYGRAPNARKPTP